MRRFGLIEADHATFGDLAPEAFIGEGTMNGPGLSFLHTIDIGKIKCLVFYQLASIN